MRHESAGYPASVSRLPGILAIALLVGACSGAGATTEHATDTTLTVAPDHTADEFIAYVTLTEQGTEPAILFLPAGHPVRLVIRSRVPEERHFRVGGLVVSDLAWLQEPEYTLFELEQMSPEDQAAVGFDPARSEADHTEHHLMPTWVPTKPASESGIKPIGNEVHGYTNGVGTEVLRFFPLTTGRYVAQDPLHPELGTTEVIVFDPAESS